MRILLDTHIYLWCVNDDHHLSKSVRKRILEAAEVYVSAVSIWEIAIKVKLGKLVADVEELKNGIISSGFLELPLTASHATTLMKLSNFHRDPFDRILIAQSISEPLKFITADTLLKQYSDLVEILDEY